MPRASNHPVFFPLRRGGTGQGGRSSSPTFSGDSRHRDRFWEAEFEEMPRVVERPQKSVRHRRRRRNHLSSFSPHPHSLSPPRPFPFLLLDLGGCPRQFFY
eukprot:5164584-Pyramimonas_sp.AAC.1